MMYELSKGRTVIIEGIHLDPSFMAKIMNKYEHCLCFVICVKAWNEHCNDEYI